MFALTPQHRFYFYTLLCDMRKSFFTLSGLVRDTMGKDLENGDAYTFITLDYKHIEDTVFKMSASDFWYIHYYECPVYHTSQEEQHLLNGWWRQMEWFDRQKNSSQRDNLLANCFLVFLFTVEAIITELPSKPLPDTRSRKLIVDFYKLLSQHCKQHQIGRAHV